jgi:hypothetical protein
MTQAFSEILMSYTAAPSTTSSLNMLAGTLIINLKREREENALSHVRFNSPVHGKCSDCTVPHISWNRMLTVTAIPPLSLAMHGGT